MSESETDETNKQWKGTQVNLTLKWKGVVLLVNLNGKKHWPKDSSTFEGFYLCRVSEHK